MSKQVDVAARCHLQRQHCLHRTFVTSAIEMNAFVVQNAVAAEPGVVAEEIAVAGVAEVAFAAVIATFVNNFVVPKLSSFLVTRLYWTTADVVAYDAIHLSSLLVEQTLVVQVNVDVVAATFGQTGLHSLK